MCFRNEMESCPKTLVSEIFASFLPAIACFFEKDKIHLPMFYCHAWSVHRGTAPPVEAMQDNMVLAAEIMDSFQPWLNPEKWMKEWTHIPEIGYYKEPPISINDVMIKYFRQTEESIINSIM